MTQLTFNQRSAFVERQRQRSGDRDPSPSPSPVSASEGNAQPQARMARVRRNSHTGRRRLPSDQTQSDQRDLRPKAATSETSLPAISQPPLYTQFPLPPPPAGVQYRGIPPPPQLVTANWNLGHSGFADAKSPESLISPDSSSFTYNAYDSSSYASDRNRTLTPLEYTPTHSVSSYDRSTSQDGLSAFVSNRTRSDSGSTSFYDRALNHGVSISLKSWPYT